MPTEKNNAWKKKYVLLLLLYYVIFTSFFVINTLSKYTGDVQGDGDIGVAKWDVSLDTTSSNSTLNLVAGNTSQTYILSLTSTSEVAVDYSIKLTGVSSQVEVSVDGGTAMSPTAGEIIFTNVGSFDANDTTSTKSHSLTFSAPLGSSNVSNNQIDIDVIFTQKNI